MKDDNGKQPRVSAEAGPRLSRRDLLKGTALAVGSAAAPVIACGGGSVAPRAMKKKVIILGFDAVSPVLLREFMARGELPHISRLASDGTFTELGSSIPPESPVAWSTFSVSAQAGVHGIYDFLNRDVETYTPRIASVDPINPEFLWDLIPVKKPGAICKRTGKPFWVHAAEHGVKSAVIEAPVSFPAPKLEAGSLLLTGLTTPDLRGTQGTYHYFTTDIFGEDMEDTEFGGKVSALEFDSSGRAEVKVIGPWNPVTRQKRDRLKRKRRELAASGAGRMELAEIDKDFAGLERENYLVLPAVFTLSPDRGSLSVEIDGQSLELRQGEWSEPVELGFRLNFLITVRGFARFVALEIGDQVRVFMSPVEIHPEEPVLPISCPEDFAGRLARRIGLYKTRGWAAETAGLKEGKIDEQAFLDDLHRIMDQREAMLHEVLEQDRPNLFFELFSCIDRAQHMFWRLVDKQHPMYDPDLDSRFGGALLAVYKKMDDIVGRLRERYEDENTLLMLCSDHGFSSFRKGVNINTWLVNNGYMKLEGQDDPRYNLRELFGGGDFFRNVDWSGTRAYSLGLGLVFINLQGRESRGIVSPGAEYDSLVREIGDKLLTLRDPEDGAAVVSKVFAGREVYSGQRLDEAPDLVVGFSINYRVSWQTALGGIPPEELEYNMEKWSGDHCSVDRDLVPGVLLANRAVKRRNPDLRDIAPTALRFLGCPVPGAYEGKDLFEA